MRAPSIRQMLIAITAALTVMIALFTTRDIYDNWQRLGVVENLRDASVLSDRLFGASETLAVERDVALAMLQAADRDTVENLRPRLAEMRKGTVEALRDSLASLSRFGFAELEGVTTSMIAHLAAIDEMRPQIDGATSLEIYDRDPHLATRWTMEVNQLTEDSDRLWNGFVRHFTNIDPVVTQYQGFKHFLRTITDYTGRERSLIGQLIAESADPSPQQIAGLQRGQGIVEQSWGTSRALADQGGFYSAIASAYTDAQSHYTTTHGMIENLFYMPGTRQGNVYPISADLWFELSTEASDSLTTLRNIAIEQSSRYVNGLISETERAILAAGLIFLLSVILCAASFWIVIGRVIRPINRMVGALLAARNDGAGILLDANEVDEIAKLSIVLRSFQENVEEVKRTSAELARSQKRLRAVVNYAVDGLFTTDANGVIERFNPACERIFGYPASEMIGKNIAMLMPETAPWDKAAYLPAEAKAGEEARASTVELTARRKDGTTFPMELSVAGFALEDGLHFSGIARDITRKKQAHEELTRHTQALERSNKELDDFAYIASHDLKEPLRGIHNHSRFLLEDNGEKLDKESVGRLTRLIYLSQRMERLVNDLLYFSRLGRQELAVQATDLNAVIRDIESTLEMFLSERGAQIVIPKELPTIICDKPRVAELFRNLITNAVKYNDKAEKIVEVGHLDSHSMRDGAVARNVFYVRDNGKGIGPEFHEEIFRIFRRLQSATEGAEEGTGVGLTFVKKIVERHGGRIWVESTPGNGATFYFTLEEQHHDADGPSKVAA
jgi:PAS domain S-box-containing protein